MAQKEKWLLASGVLLVGFAVDRPVQSWRGDSFSPFMRQYVEPFGKEFGLVGSLAFLDTPIWLRIGKPVRRLLVWGVHWYSAIWERTGSR